MAVEYDGGVVIGADSRTTTGYVTSALVVDSSLFLFPQWHRSYLWMGELFNVTTTYSSSLLSLFPPAARISQTE